MRKNRENILYSLVYPCRNHFQSMDKDTVLCKECISTKTKELNRLIISRKRKIVLEIADVGKVVSLKKCAGCPRYIIAKKWRRLCRPCAYNRLLENNNKSRRRLKTTDKIRV